MKRKILAVVMAAAVLFVAQAQGMKGGGGGGSGGGGSGGGGQASTVDRPDAGRGVMGFDTAEALRSWERLHLTDQEREQIRKMLSERDGELLRIRAEIREMQARMSRLMLQERVDKTEIEKTLRQSMELELRMRMIQVDRNLRIREMLGMERWAELYRFAEMTQRALRLGQLDSFLSRTADPERARAFCLLLEGVY